MATKSKAASVSKSKRAGLQFPVGRVKSYLKKVFTGRVSAAAAVALAAAEEYIIRDLLSQEAMRGVMGIGKSAKSRVTPRHILLRVKGDHELNKLWKNTTLAAGGVVPHIQKALLPAKAQSAEGEEGAAPKKRRKSSKKRSKKGSKKSPKKSKKGSKKGSKGKKKSKKGSKKGSKKAEEPAE